MRASRVTPVSLAFSRSDVSVLAEGESRTFLFVFSRYVSRRGRRVSKHAGRCSECNECVVRRSFIFARTKRSSRHLTRDARRGGRQVAIVKWSPNVGTGGRDARCRINSDDARLTHSVCGFPFLPLGLATLSLSLARSDDHRPCDRANFQPSGRENARRKYIESLRIPPGERAPLFFFFFLCIVVLRGSDANQRQRKIRPEFIRGIGKRALPREGGSPLSRSIRSLKTCMRVRRSI